MVSTKNITSGILGRILAFSFLITRGSACSVDDEVLLELNNTCKLPCKPNNVSESSYLVKWYLSAGNGDDCYYQDQHQEPTIASLTGTALVVKDGYSMDKNDFSLTIVQGSEEDIGLFRCTITTITFARYNYDVKTKLKNPIVPSHKDEGSTTVTTPAMEAADTSRAPHTRSRPPTLLEPDNSSNGRIGLGTGISIGVIIIIIIFVAYKRHKKMLEEGKNKDTEKQKCPEKKKMNKQRLKQILLSCSDECGECRVCAVTSDPEEQKLHSTAAGQNC